MKTGLNHPLNRTKTPQQGMLIYADDIENIPPYTVGGGRGRGHSEVIIKGPDIDDDRYDDLGVHCGEYE